MALSKAHQPQNPLSKANRPYSVLPAVHNRTAGRPARLPHLTYRRTTIRRGRRARHNHLHRLNQRFPDRPHLRLLHTVRHVTAERIVYRTGNLSAYRLSPGEIHPYIYSPIFQPCRRDFSPPHLIYRCAACRRRGRSMQAGTREVNDLDQGFCQQKKGG